MPKLSDLANEQYRQKLAREYTHVPQSFTNPIGDYLKERARMIGRSAASLGDLASWQQAGRNLQGVSEDLQNDPAQLLGIGMMRVRPEQIAGLMSDAEKAMLQYELSKIPKKPVVSLRDLAIGGGALGGGGLLGYYGTEYLGGER